MPIKEDDNNIIFVEILKKETLKDLLHFDGESQTVFLKFGIKDNNKNQIADLLTKLISTNIKANILKYIEDLIESTNPQKDVPIDNNTNNEDGVKKDGKKGK